MRNALLLHLFFTSVLLCSCSDCDAPIPHETLSTIDYLPMTRGSWWAYVNKRHQIGESPVVLSRDTLWALGDTLISGNTYALFHGRLEGYGANGIFAIRDSVFHIVRANGQLVLPYHNFTDTFAYGADTSMGTYFFQRMVQDTVLTVVPAGAFASVDFISEIGRGIAAQSICVEFPVGYCHFKFSAGVGMLLSTYWYSAPGPCIYFSRELEAFHIE